MHKNASGDVVHDFTVRARSVVEETIGRRIAPPKPGPPAQNQTEAVVRAIVGRNNIRSTVRCTGIPQNQVKAMVVEVGESCARLHQKLAQHVACRSLHCNTRMVLQEKNRGLVNDRVRSVGSAWTWTSIDLETKFVPHWRVAPRDTESADTFLRELTAYKPVHVRVTTNGHWPFEWRHDQTSIGDEVLERASGLGFGDVADVPWLEVLSEGFVRKIHRHSVALALLFTYHNFAVTDSVTNMTPAMAIGITNRPWSVTEMVEQLRGL